MNVKRFIATILTLALMCSFVPAAFAATDEATQAAQALYDLGLFQGIGNNADGTPNFDLDRTPTRHEAVTMLVRLLGKDGEAKAGTWEMPFTDVADWAIPYVGYAYTNGLTTGTSETTYGGDSLVDAAQYLTFVLRALGYTSGADFQWDKPWELSDAIGLTNGNYNADTADFTRGDVVVLSYTAIEKKTEIMKKETPVTLYAADGRTIDVWPSDVPAYLQAGWHESKVEKSIDDLVHYIKTEGTINDDGNWYVRKVGSANVGSFETNTVNAYGFIYDQSDNSIQFSSILMMDEVSVVISFDYDVAPRKLKTNPAISYVDENKGFTATTYLNMETYTSGTKNEFVFGEYVTKTDGKTYMPDDVKNTISNYLSDIFNLTMKLFDEAMREFANVGLKDVGFTSYQSMP